MVTLEQEQQEQQQLKVNPEYEKLIPELSKQDYEELKDSIATNGVYIPVIKNSQNLLLDGHHRRKAWLELGHDESTLPTKTRDFTDPLQEKLFVIDCNLRRRHLTLVQRAALATERHKIISEQTRKLQKDSGKLGGRPPHQQKQKEKTLTTKVTPSVKRTTESNKKRRMSKASHQAAKAENISDRTLERYQYVIEHGKPELVQKMKLNWVKISKAYKLVKKEERLEEAMKESPNPYLDLHPGTPAECRWSITEGDMQTMGKRVIADNSIDLIFTDPPYDEKSLPLYIDLAGLAQRVLKPGGSLISFVGHHVMIEAAKLIEKRQSLVFHCPLFVVHGGGPRSRLWREGVWAKTKVLLWYYKLGALVKKPTMFKEICDTIQSEKPSKDFHEWEQSPVEAKTVIETLTIPNQIVLDPFMGSGTTGLAALQLGRRFVGIEQDKATFEIARRRLQTVSEVVVVKKDA